MRGLGYNIVYGFLFSVNLQSTWNTIQHNNNQVKGAFREATSRATAEGSQRAVSLFAEVLWSHSWTKLSNLNLQIIDNSGFDLYTKASGIIYPT